MLFNNPFFQSPVVYVVSEATVKEAQENYKKQRLENLKARKERIEKEIEELVAA